jgi:hypothetical protein
VYQQVFCAEPASSISCMNSALTAWQAANDECVHAVFGVAEEHF